MKFTRIELHNWRNFRILDVPLCERTFLVGPNAVGKSNFLDAFRFLHDVADPRGGLQSAVARRGAIPELRCLEAADPTAEIGLEVEVTLDDAEVWTYRLELGEDGGSGPRICREVVHRGTDLLLARPDQDDEADPSRLTETHLEQVNANLTFRVLRQGFAEIRYLHVVPHLLRDAERSVGRDGDPYGGDFLARLGKLPAARVESRLEEILVALRGAVPQLAELELYRTASGVVHLRSRCQHWRGETWLDEQVLSDGTLRLFGLLWALLEEGPTLLEEPELSLHGAILPYIPLLIARSSRLMGCQALVSTHSAELLSDEGIAAEEVLLFEPSQDGTRVSPASCDREICALVEGGLTIGDAVIPRTAPPNAGDILCFAT